MRMLRNPSVWALPVILASSAQALTALSPLAPTLSRVGDGMVDASRLRPYDNAFVLTVTRADGQVVQPGIWTDQLRLRTVDGRQAFVRTQGLAYFNGMVMTSVNVFDPATFAPISNIQNNPDGTREHWSFRGLAVEGHLTGAAPESRETVQNLTLTRPSYDFNCCMRSLLPAAVRLRAGQTFTVPAVEAAGDPREITYHVAGRVRVRAGYRGTIPAWLVQTDGPGGGTISFWIADTPPYLVRMTLTGIPANHDSHGVHYDQSFDMLG